MGTPICVHRLKIYLFIYDVPFRSYWRKGQRSKVLALQGSNRVKMPYALILSIGCSILLRNHSNEAFHIWFFIVFTWWTFWDHCQQNRIIFTRLTPVEPKIKHLIFSSVTTKRYVVMVVDRSNYTFFSESLTRGMCWYGSRQHWSNFWIWPLYKLSCDPQTSCTGCDPAAIWNTDPWTHANVMKLHRLRNRGAGG